MNSNGIGMMKISSQLDKNRKEWISHTVLMVATSYFCWYEVGGGGGI